MRFLLPSIFLTLTRRTFLNLCMCNVVAREKTLEINDPSFCCVNTRYIFGLDGSMCCDNNINNGNAWHTQKKWSAD